MTLREACTEIVGIDSDPLGCAFIIVATMRTGAQGEPSTFEGECASLNKATELGIKYETGDDIRKWLDDIAALADLDMPIEFWLNLVSADTEESE